MEAYLFIALVLTICIVMIGGFGIVAFRLGRGDRDNHIKADGGHGNPVASFWTWCYWKGVGMTEEEGAREWEDYLRRFR